MVRASEVPRIASTSGLFSWSADSTCTMICVSFWKPSGKSGRIGRSIRRADRISVSAGRASRLKNPPGILPAAYMRSRYSTVSGKNGNRVGSSCATAVQSNTVSPYVSSTAPCACRAIRPVSSTRRRPANIHSFLCISLSLFSLPLRRAPVAPRSCEHSGTEKRTQRQRPPSDVPLRGYGHGIAGRRLMTKTQIVDQRAISLQIRLLEVVQQTAALADHHQQPATAVVILLVRAEVIGELVDPLRQQSDLDRRAAPVVLVQLVLLDDGILVGRCHSGCLSESLRWS